MQEEPNKKSLKFFHIFGYRQEKPKKKKRFKIPSHFWLPARQNPIEKSGNDSKKKTIKMW
jgi:hypothetical protein